MIQEESSPLYKLYIFPTLPVCTVVGEAETNKLNAIKYMHTNTMQKNVNEELAPTS